MDFSLLSAEKKCVSLSQEGGHTLALSTTPLHLFSTMISFSSFSGVNGIDLYTS